MIDYKDLEPQLRGLWPEIFASIGITIPKMRGKNSVNGPCPVCNDGIDRAHWRDADGRLALYCRVCAPDSMWSPESVYMKITGVTFSDFCGDMCKFINFIPIETRSKIKNNIITKSDPSYCSSLTTDECNEYINKNQGSVLIPIHKRINGNIVMCNVAKITKSVVEYASGSWSHRGFAIIGAGKIEITTPSYEVAKWYADKFDCGVIWALNPLNLRDMLYISTRPVRVVMEWDFNALCEIEKGNPDQIIEIIDIKTGLRSVTDKIENILNCAKCGDIAQQSEA